MAQSVIAAATSFNLPLPDFPAILLNKQWQNNREGSPKLNIAAYSIRCTLCAASGISVHRTPGKKKHDIWNDCLQTYSDQCKSLKAKYPEAAVLPFLEYTALNQLTTMSGKKIWRMSQMVRKEINNVYNPLWCRYYVCLIVCFIHACVHSYVC